MPKLSEMLDETRKAELLRALQLHQGNIGRAAKDLGITRKQVYRYVAQWDLMPYIAGLRQGSPPNDPEEL